MSIHLHLDESLVQVTPTLDDIEPSVLVYTRRQGDTTGADGVVFEVCKNALLPKRNIEPELTTSVLETHLVGHAGRSFQGHQVDTLYLAGGVGAMRLTGARSCTFYVRWYGRSMRYCEIRLLVTPGAEVAVNRGMASLRDGVGNVLVALRGGTWVEMHFDNHAHTGIFTAVHPASADITRPSLHRPGKGPSRWDLVVKGIL